MIYLSELLKHYFTDEKIIETWETCDQCGINTMISTIEFMKSCPKPWIAYKVLAAGAIQPADGFKYAFENGADFACVVMCDFQVREDAIIANKVVTGLTRPRPWRA